MISKILYLNALVCLLFSSVVFSAEHITIGDFSHESRTAVPSGWHLKEKTGNADVSLVIEEGINAVHMQSSGSSFSLEKEVHIDLKKYPILSWKWKVAKLPKGGDFRKTGTDDQAAQLFLAFSKTRAIVYIWDSSAPEGTMADTAAPFFMSIKAVVVRSGPSKIGTWITETRNVYDDYRMLFKQEPGEVAGVRLQINSQHTGTSAESYFADIAFRNQ